MWSYIHRSMWGDTKVCGVIFIEDMWGTQKYVALYTLKLCGGTKVCGVIYIDDMWGIQKYVEFYT